MQDYIDDAEETLSLSNFHVDDDASDSEQLNHSTVSSSSSSSSSLSGSDFLGFYSEGWSKNTSFSNSPENIIFCGKVVSSGDQPFAGGTKSQTNPLFRSNSDSFRSIRLKTASRAPIPSRSQSLPNRSASFPCKSRLMVFMFGSGSSKFPTKMDMDYIKSRQLRQPSATAAPRGVFDGGKEDSDGRRSGNKGWWRLVDVLGCGGGYVREIHG